MEWKNAVKDKPEDGQRVLVAIKGVAEPEKATYNKFLDEYFIDHHLGNCDVVAWMSMPVLPWKKQQNENLS